MTASVALPLPFVCFPPSRVRPKLSPITFSRPRIFPLISSSEFRCRRQRPSLIMSQSSAAELRDQSDFYNLLSPSGFISICGFGSLLSERSARSTFPDLVNFRVARLNGFRRAFAHVAPIFFDRGIAKPETKEISSLSVEPCESETLIVTVFDIKESEIPAFIEREHEFRFLAVVPETLDGSPFGSSAVLCTRYSDEEFFEIRCKGNLLCLFLRSTWPT
uniref:Uncharacterized protein n=1 Tax=Rhizophora mucronata TaxID=61149 RepID=A0A2P2IYN9_RHIMU